jgi:hypothetical protein
MRWVNSSFYLLVSIFWLITPFSNFSFKLPHLAKILPIFTPSRILWAFGEVGPCHVFGFVRCFFYGFLRAVFCTMVMHFIFISDAESESAVLNSHANILAQCTVIGVGFSIIQRLQTLKDPTEIRSKEQTCEAPVVAVAAIAGLPPLSPTSPYSLGCRRAARSSTLPSR